MSCFLIKVHAWEFIPRSVGFFNWNIWMQGCWGWHRQAGQEARNRILNVVTVDMKTTLEWEAKTVRSGHVIGCGQPRRQLKEKGRKNCPAGGSSTALPVGCSGQLWASKGKSRGWSELEINCCEPSYQKQPRWREAREARNAKRDDR